jgi:glycosyltransferase involved in cell wall biosynthesis
MNRAYHLITTLPVNLINSESYPNREFVIVDYNSRDGLYNWAKDHLRPWIDKGIVKYCRTRIPTHFSATHAKNIAHKQASGDIVCNIDSDNFVMEGFCEYLAKAFEQPNIAFSCSSEDRHGNHGCCGKIAVRKEHFLSVNGYDEAQSDGWGWEDVSFRYRVTEHNNLTPFYSDIKWNCVIGHNNIERCKNFKIKNLDESEEWSKNRLMQLSVRKQFVVNTDHLWGYVEDLKIGL